MLVEPLRQETTQRTQPVVGVLLGYALLTTQPTNFLLIVLIHYQHDF